MRTLTSFLSPITFGLALVGLVGVGGCGKTNLEVGANGKSAPVPATADIAVGSGFACAILPDRTVACWGANESGQTGSPPVAGPDGFPTGVARPTRVPGLANVVQLSAIASVACAVVQTGDVYCWGNLGDAMFAAAITNGSQTSTPIRMEGLDHVAEFRTGGFFGGNGCARKMDGSVWCWGDDWSSAGPAAPPQRVAGIDDAVAIAVGTAGDLE
jgi:alpha-tubulin suppressor-like RCC1 family protein